MLYGLSNASLCVVFLANLNGATSISITYTTYFFFVLTSIFHLIFIAVDRLWAVMLPIKHNVIMTRRKVHIALGAVWSMTILISLALYFSNEGGNWFQDDYSLEPIVNHNETSNSTSAIVSMQMVNSISANTKTTTTTTTAITSYARRNDTQRSTRKPSPTKIPRSTKTPRSTKSRPSNRTNTPLFRKKLVTSRKEKYKLFIQDLLSWFIIGADTLLICLYSLIIYRVHVSNRDAKIQSQSDHSTNKIGLVCVFVAASFVLFTLPYAVSTLVSGAAGFWANIILVSNSGLNCVVYFFKNRCEHAAQQKRRQKDLTSSVGVFTPVSSRRSTSDSVISTPLGTPNPNNLRVSHTKL